VEDYKAGLSLPQIHRKYGVSIAHAYEVVKRAGVNRSISEALLFRRGGWRKLVRINRSICRLVSLPSSVLRKAGYDPEEDWRADWIVRGNKMLELRVSKRGRLKLSRLGQRKNAPGICRLISLRSALLVKIGLDPREELEGRWEVRGKRIFLHVRIALSD